MNKYDPQQSHRKFLMMLGEQKWENEK